MNARRVNLYFRLIAIASAASAACIVAAVIAMPKPKVAAIGVAHAATATSQPTVAASAMPSLKAIALVADVPLRRSLEDPKPLAIAAPTSRPAAYELTLRGTIVEPGRAFAVFARPAGDVAVCEAGDRIDGAEVQRIDARAVVLRIGEQSIVLEVPVPQASGPLGS